MPGPCQAFVSCDEGRCVSNPFVCSRLAFSPYIGPSRFWKESAVGSITGAMQFSDAHFVGVDIGGTKVAAGLVDYTGKITRQTRTPMVATDAVAGLAAVT